MSNSNIKKFMESVNALTLADAELPVLKRDVEALESLLATLAGASATGTLASCYVKTLLQTTRHDILTFIKVLEKAINNNENSELKAELEEACESLKQLLERCEKLDKDFLPYLFCPALEQPN